MHDTIHTVNVKLTWAHRVKHQGIIKPQITILVLSYFEHGAGRSAQVSLFVSRGTSLVALMFSSIFYSCHLGWQEAWSNWLVKIMFNRQVFISKENLKMHFFHPLLIDGRIFSALVFVLITAHLFYLFNFISGCRNSLCKVTPLASDFIMSYDSLYHLYLESKSIFVNWISLKRATNFKWLISIQHFPKHKGAIL